MWTMSIRVLDLEIKQFSDLDIPFLNNMNCIHEVTKCVFLGQYESIL